MHAGNWQVEFLILVMSAVALLLAACGLRDEPTKIADIIPVCEINSSEEITTEHIREVERKYEDLFRRQPYFQWIGNGYDDSEGFTEINGIVIEVLKKVDQSELPPEYRIPDCLEGVPVLIIEGHIACTADLSADECNKINEELRSQPWTPEPLNSSLSHSYPASKSAQRYTNSWNGG